MDREAWQDAMILDGSARGFGGNYRLESNEVFDFGEAEVITNL